tara:strand:+ start:1863 stop:2264 length:402 start_codon:yes stop_codon:yes gene_type:complete
MLINVSYNNPKIKSKINSLIGSPYSFFERIKMGGVGSRNLKILGSSTQIQNVLNLDNNQNRCNIEIRKKGIIIFFRSLLETYALVIPFYKLNIFKGDSNIYSVHIDQFKINIQVKNKSDFNFFKKIQRSKISN